MRYVLNLGTEPGWPDFGALPSGRPVRLSEVEPMVRSGELSEDDAVMVSFADDDGNRSWPWKNAGYYVNEDGSPVQLVSTGPTMTRSELAKVGFSDEKLEAEWRRLHCAVDAAGPALTDAAPETIAAQQRRRAIFDAVTAAWHRRASRTEHEQWGEDAFPGLMEEADEWCAGPQPDWIEVADIKDEADKLRAAGKLDDEARRILLDRARDAIPEDRPEIFAETEAAIRRDG